MRDRLKRTGLGVVLGSAVLVASLVAAPAASAAKFLGPSFLSFGNQPVGVVSASKSLTLTVTCVPDPGNPFICLGPDTLNPQIAATGDFAQTNNCPATMNSGMTFTGVSCTINVSFTPTAEYHREGLLTAGPGLFASLIGTGIAPPAPPATTSKKKCKKKSGRVAAAAKKKCKKKRK